MERQESCKWEIGACSETGRRSENEDRMSSIRIGQNRLYLVADGMGGHKAGALAAQLTIQGLEAGMTQLLPAHPVKEAITKAFSNTNQHVYAQAHSNNAETANMGSTAVILLTQGSTAYIAHVGDSRAYLFTKGRLKRLTKDHSLVDRMVNAGILTPAEARDHPQSNEIERAIGNKQQVEVDISEPFQVEEGDGILLCSDGLNGYVDDRDIEAVLRRSATAQEAVNKLVQTALDVGSEDNITVQFVRRKSRKSLIGNSVILWLKNISSFSLKTIVPLMLALIALYSLAAFFNNETPQPVPAAPEPPQPNLIEQTIQRLEKQVETTQNELKNTQNDLKITQDALKTTQNELKIIASKKKPKKPTNNTQKNIQPTNKQALQAKQSAHSRIKQ